MLNCQELAHEITLSVKKAIAALPQLQPRPSLAVISVGHDPAATIYVNNKLRKCHELGILCQHFSLNVAVAESQILTLIQQLNDDNNIHAILVQLPLPEHISKHRLINSIAPAKDVDGFSYQNAGLLAQGQLEEAIIPCTPKGILYIMDVFFDKSLSDYSNNKYAGARVVILGRSDIVGKPLANILINLGATVIICNKSTVNLNQILALAEVLIVAIGSAQQIELSCLKNNCLVIDVGINVVSAYNQSRKICGDVIADSTLIHSKSLTVTPVPKGVGLLTVAMLMSNILTCYYKNQHF